MSSPHALRRSAALFVSAIALLLPAVPADAGTTARPPTAPDLARQSGKPVPVPSAQTATSDVVANPDGTFTETFHTEPVRVRRGAGWTPVDTTLERRTDGTVGPRATSIPTSFSGGGNGPLVRLGADGTQLSYSWPKALPRPTLDGSTATYRDVLPGVDLRLTAKAQGFSKVFVIHNAAAAKQLSTLRLGVSADGLSVRDTKAGSFGAYDSTGRLVYTAGAPLMWDAAGKRAVGTSKLSGTTLSISPDQNLLTSRSTTYPVYLDPDTTGPLYGWAMVFSGHPEDEYWGGDGDGVAKVGDCYDANNECYGIGVARSYFRFDVRDLLGGRKLIKSASFNAFLDHVPDCSRPRTVRASSTAPVGTGTNWNNRPGIATSLGDVMPPQCKDIWLGWSAVRAVNDGLSLHSGWATIALSATNEADQYAWKKFGTRPTLSVTYNTRPGVPTDLAVEGQLCRGQEIFVNPAVSGEEEDQTRGPVLSVKATEDDPQLIRAVFEWADRAHNRIGGATTGLFASGTTFKAGVPAANAAHGSRLSFRAFASDDVDGSGWSGYCDLTIDKVAPQEAPAVHSDTYLECTAASCPRSGGVGFTGGFTFTAGLTDTDVAGFRYSLLGAFENRYATVGSDGVAHALVTPPDYGPQFLSVRAVDRAGNVSAAATVYEFFVKNGGSPTAAWRLNGEGVDTAVVDDAAGHRDGVRPAAPAAQWKGGRNGDALWLNGSQSAYVTASGTPAVDTGKSFTVSAWVKLDQAGTVYRTAVSQNGSRLSGFFLQYNPNTKKWNFMMPASDADAAARHVAASVGPAVPGRWTHLAGVFDDSTKQVTLYVDGVQGTTASHSTPWRAAGATQLGRAQYQATGADNWLGSLDDVQVFDRVLTTAEIDDLAGKPAAEQVFWPLDESAGAQISDVSGNYRLGTAAVGVTRTAGAVGTGAVRLDGSGGITGPAAVVRTDSSFTVSARVKLDAVDDVSRTVLSQDGQQSSGFQLGYDGPKRRWFFGLSQADSATDLPVTVTDSSAPTVGEWTLLTGLYDQATGQIRLYVDGRQVGGYVAAQAKWNAVGAFQVGAARKAGQVATPFAGEIDDVHVWSGVRTEGQVQDELAHPVTTRRTAYSGQLSYFMDTNGFRMVTNGPVPQSSHFQKSLGVPAPAGSANTTTIYACRNGATDYFLDATCAGHTVLGSVGQFWNSPPAGVETVPVYRCYISMVAHFASNDENCDGVAGATAEFRLGYVRPYFALVRTNATNHPYDHISSTAKQAATQRAEFSLGYLAMRQLTGTTPWMLCRDGSDSFTSTDPGCEGKTVVAVSGYGWTDAAPGRAEVFRCRASWGELFDSRDAGCEGDQHTLVRSVGYVAASL
ncbi:LamG-like jellyroll fold domain-containing protein [Kribbella sindirgiensis]|uniref:LamG domain-containing protein n=1 Tax=Kribbella sindirgiensis TaxID=1124744 RepID=A0A4R0IJI5_9ACTN|nr:LamG-like jellyroll fold domain-containing protein [Kribbella sindirgiensis]TCC32370.1 LamG domain-containing protein [Kribbella sindirgiensis]